MSPFSPRLRRFPMAATLVHVALIASLSSAAYAIDGPLTPEQAIASFKLEPGLRIEAVAAEPMVVDPVAVCFDEKGRMYVAEDRGYPTGPGKGKPPEGQIVLLESSKGDGHYDKRTVFADKLAFPNGVMPWKGGLFVTCAPYLYYFKDTNSDGVADVKRTLFKGFQDLSTTQLRVSHPTLAIDNWVYLTSGLTSAKIKTPEFPERPEIYCNRTDVRFNPQTLEIEPTAGTAQFGQTFDNFGRKFICSNRNHNQHVVMQLKYLKRNPDLNFSEVVQDTPDHGAAAKVFPLSHNITTAAFHAGYFTSACAVTYYGGTALPEKYRGNTFTCEPAGNLVHHDVLSASNATFVTRREFETQEFIASPDNWFRPVNLAHGPDGALYLCDMYRKTIEHPDYLPESMRATTDFVSGKTMGRIYRIVADQPAKNEKPKKFDLSKASTKELCALLDHPNVWWRSTAQRLLLERQDAKAAPLLKKIVKTGKTAEARALALRLLDGLGALDEASISLALGDNDPNVREHGIQMAELRLTVSPELLARVQTLAGDANARVRFQCALSLGAVDHPNTIPALAQIAEQNLDDKWIRAAVLTSVHHRSGQLLQLLLAGKNKNSDGMSAMLVELCRILGATEEPKVLAGLLNQLTASQAEADFAWQLSAVTGLTEGLRHRENSLASILSHPATEAATRQRLTQMIQRSQGTALDLKQPLAERLVAIELLSQAESSVAGATLQKLIDPQQAAEVQTAAVRSIGRLPDPSAASALMRKERWSSYTPAVRDAVLTLIMAKPALIETLLGAIEKGEIPAWTVNGDRRGQLMKHKEESIKGRALALFKDMKAGDRTKVYEDYKSVLSLAPNSKNGHALFTKTCTACHTFSGEGTAVGPDLTGIRNQPKDVLLLHIIVPEFEIMPTYTLYAVETKDGQSFGGLLAAETPDSVTLRQSLGVQQKISRANITSMSSSALSLMPQELEKTMSKQDMADLIGFLKGE
jgi:putative membrane-bound dehydrogenase-like protein